jgi:CRP/FNR family transcriptional regulator
LDISLQEICSSPLFEGLSQEQCESLAHIARRRAFERGQKIFSEGDEGTGFYTISSGRVKIFKLSPEGKEQIFHVFGPGDVFGEVAVFTGQGYPANAQAREKSSLLFFPRESFKGLIGKDPSFALNMLATLSWRLHRFTALVEDLSLKEVPGRLAAHLLYLSQKQNGSDELILDMSKGQLAGLLGTIPETISRILNKMTRRGLILVKKTSIRILNRRDLEEISRGEKRLTR